MDIWVRCTPENYQKIVQAFNSFGMPLYDMTLDNFLNTEKWDVFRFGRKPIAIDIMTKVKGLEFEEAFKAGNLIKVDGISVGLIQYDHLIAAKKQAGRSKDIQDLENL